MDRWTELRTFVAVADHAGFAPAAAALGVASSSVSRQIANLEDRLGVRLFTRTTRRVSLTEAGDRLLERGRSLLRGLEEVEADVSGLGATPRGALRVSCVVALAERWLPPLVASFLETYPQVSVELRETESFVDPIGDSVDVAVVAGPYPDSSHIKRQLCAFRRLVVAAPDYIDRHGSPETPSDLGRHNCLAFAGMPHLQKWPFRSPGGTDSEVAVRGHFSSSSAATLLQATLAGTGIARLADFIVAPHLKSGRLSEVLVSFRSPEEVALSAIFPQSARLSPKTRAFVEHLVDGFAPHPPWSLEVSD